MNAQRANVHAVLVRAAGDAQGPIEGGQAYAALEAYRALRRAAWRVLCEQDALGLRSQETDELRAALERVGGAA
jgi:hypothetical protein